MKRVCCEIICILLICGNCIAQKRAIRHISTNTTIERTVLTVSIEHKATQDSIEHGKEHIDVLRLPRIEEPERGINKPQGEQVYQPEISNHHQQTAQEETKKKWSEKEQQKQVQENIARNADPYYIAWLIKTQSLDNSYRQEVQAQFDIPTIMRLVNEYAEEELLLKAKGYHSYLYKYKK